MLHPLTSEDVLTDFTREKIESYENYLFVVIEALSAGDQVENVFVVVYGEFVVTFHARPTALVDTVISELSAKDAFLRSDWVLYIIVRASYRALWLSAYGKGFCCVDR